MTRGTTMRIAAACVATSMFVAVASAQTPSRSESPGASPDAPHTAPSRPALGRSPDAPHTAPSRPALGRSPDAPHAAPSRPALGRSPDAPSRPALDESPDAPRTPPPRPESLGDSLNRLEGLQAEVDELRRENRRLKRRLSRLERQMRTLSRHRRATQEEQQSATPAPEQGGRPAVADAPVPERSVATPIDRPASQGGSGGVFGVIRGMFSDDEGRATDARIVPPVAEESTPGRTPAPAASAASASAESPTAPQAAPFEDDDTAGSGIVYGRPGNERSRRQYERAMEWLDKNEPEQFKIAMSDWLSRNPGDEYEEDALYWLAEAYYRDKQWAQARRHYARLLKKFPKTRRRDAVRLQLASVHRKEGNHETAKRLLLELSESEDANIRRQAKSRLRTGESR